MKLQDMKISEMFLSIQGEGNTVGRPSIFLRLSGCVLNCRWCLGGNTEIFTRKGVKKLRDVEIGDDVWSYNETTGKQEYTQVTNAISRKDADVLSIRFDRGGTRQGRALATAEHPFWVIGKGWTVAADLKKGDVIMDKDDSAHLSENRKGKPSCISGAARKRMSARMKAANPMFDKDAAARSQKTRKANGHVPPLAALWKTPEFRAIVSKRMRENNPMFNPEISAKSANRPWGRDSRLEQVANLLIEKLDLPLIRNKGKVNIGGRIPDYIVKDKKIVVELTHPTFYRRQEEGYDIKNAAHYAKHGWKCYTVYGKTNTSKDRHNLAGRLIEVSHNGKTVVSVSKHPRKIEVFNLTTANHTFFANGALSHNCDTAEVWKKGVHWNFESLYSYFNEQGWIAMLNSGDVQLVITGGDPLLQQTELIQWFAYLEHYGQEPLGWRIEVENQASIMPKPELARYVTQWNLSPKLENSGEPAHRRLHKKVLDYYATSSANHAEVIYKFPVTGADDLIEVEAIMMAFFIPKDRVYLMPVASTAREHEVKGAEIAALCIKRGYRFGPRLHLALWDKATGC